MAEADVQRFNLMIEPHLDALFRAAFRLARNKPDAEDLVQETCIRAFARVGDLRQTGHVKAWLLRVMHNVYVDGARRVRRSPVDYRGDGAEVETACASDQPGPEETASAAQRAEQLGRAWRELDPDQRALLALWAEGYTLAEIAEIVRVPTDALNARLYRARRSLARSLNEEQPLATPLKIEAVK